MEDFLSQLNAHKLLLLDGATGTELTRRGVDTTLPLWSARALLDAPDTLRAIHLDYLRAGANIVTANTFRTHRRTLLRARIGHRARELTHLAVRLAQEAVREARASSDRSLFVAGSIAPLEDCYSPHLVPPDDELRAEHQELAEHLAEAGCDVLLVETMNTIREAVAAAQAAASTGLPVCVSFVAGPNGRPPHQLVDRGEAADELMVLLSGESIEDAVAAVAPFHPSVMMVNCVPLRLIGCAFDRLRAATNGPIGLYANVGHADDRIGWTLTDDVLPDAYAQCAQAWRAHGASIIGGCCGTQPAHIAALSTTFASPD